MNFNLNIKSSILPTNVGDNMSINFKSFKTPIGKLYVVANNRNLLSVIFASNWPSYKKNFKDIQGGDNKIIRATIKQLDEYFQGNRSKFKLPIKLNGSDFQKRVWSSLSRIPYGETRSYKEQAKLVKAPKAVRAIGRADGENPICIILPCHRVIGSDGSLTGYAGGLRAKRLLLSLESKIKSSKIK